MKLIKKVETNLEKKDLTINGYLQVKLDDDSYTKEGFESLEYLCEGAEFLLNKQGGSRIKFRGLMGIGKTGDLTAFSRLREMRIGLCKELGIVEETLGLSMGMSGDFERAVRKL